MRARTSLSSSTTSTRGLGGSAAGGMRPSLPVESVPNGAYAHGMTERLQVHLKESELLEAREAAGREGVPVSEWVRRALLDPCPGQTPGDPAEKVRAPRAGGGGS